MHLFTPTHKRGSQSPIQGKTRSRALSSSSRFKVIHQSRMNTWGSRRLAQSSGDQHQGTGVTKAKWRMLLNQLHAKPQFSQNRNRGAGDSSPLSRVVGF